MITIDARWLKNSGIGTYLQNIIPGVIASFPNESFCLLGKPIDMEQCGFLSKDNVHLIAAEAPMYSAWEQIDIMRKIPRNTRLYFATHFNIPLLYRGKMLVTIYDLFHLAMPDLVGGLHKSLYAKIMFSAVRRRADSIITISHFTKEELIRLTGEGGQPINPIHLGVTDDWYHIVPKDRPYPAQYILYVGNVKPHKNLGALLNAFSLICNKVPHDIVIVGKKEGFITGDKTVASVAHNLGTRVHFTGYVEDEMLRQYFSYASALVLPSFYEGFGLPPLEAMAAGCPVVVSKAASLPEICGDAALYFNPYLVEDIADKIINILQDSNLRDAMRIKGFARARQFTWEKCCAETCEVIRTLL